jgi:hypothetical protein
MSRRTHVVGLCLCSTVFAGAIFLGSAVVAAAAMADGRGTMFLFGSRRGGPPVEPPVDDHTPPLVVLLEPHNGATWRIMP